MRNPAGGGQHDVADKDERPAWIIIFATIPVGLVGVALEHTFRVLSAKPEAAAAPLSVNGLILLAAGVMRRSAARRGQAGARAAAGGPGQAFAAPAVPGSAAPGASGPAAVPGYPGGPGYGYPNVPGIRVTPPIPVTPVIPATPVPPDILTAPRAQP